MKMSAPRKSRYADSHRRFTFESLEDRRMMAALTILTDSNLKAPVQAVNSAPSISKSLAQSLSLTAPALSSLPGAANTIYLDFDGDIQAVWNRTDSNQTYQNIQAGASDLSRAEIQKVWEGVSEDFAPFNVNVTTVEPVITGNVLRVVIAGGVQADLLTTTPTGQVVTTAVGGNTFIFNNSSSGLMATTFTGYASTWSFTNGEPNVVYVFGNILRKVAVGTKEGNPLNFVAAVANTVSHEAGHSFGLGHHTGVDAAGKPNVYHIGSPTLTPIMGEVLAGDRTQWSTYTSTEDGNKYDAVARLTTVLLPRPDDYANSAWTAKQLAFSHTGFLSDTAKTYGIIENTSDEDWFKFSTWGGSVSIGLTTVELANLDAKLELFKVTSTMFGPMKTWIATVDPQIVSPFSNLGASYFANLAAGDYMIAVKSHGSYGDVGNYTLTVTLSLLGAAISQVSNPLTINKVSQWALATGGAGLTAKTAASSLSTAESGVKRTSAADALFGALGVPTADESVAVKPTTTSNMSFESSVWETLDAVLRPSLAAAQLAGVAWAAYGPFGRCLLPK
jgi:hypothetical protein